MDKNTSGLLFSRNAILDVLCQQGDLLSSRPRVESPPALVGGMGHDWFNRSVDESLKDFKWDTQ